MKELASANFTSRLPIELFVDVCASPDWVID